MKIYNEMTEKLENDLEITNLLNKIRNSDDILKNLQFKNKELLSFNKSRVVDSGS